uniref:Semaphorin-3D-like n=2 Tax=Petromyzon marinus TaxID=7757 RepID=A0AAJ7U0M4_PETMA|nr:semaphorin-3D-like [Petromyzon marinus]XP_032827638.1 semaphorin-3D-like [Petromyzon marinus]
MATPRRSCGPRSCPTLHASLLLPVLLLLLLLLLGGGSSLKPPIPRIKLSYKELQATNSSLVLALAMESSEFLEMVVDEDRGRLFVGARDHLYMLQLDNLNRAPKKIYWPPSRDKSEMCRHAGKNPLTECANFVRVLQPYNRTHLYMCGTGAYNPICAYVNLGQKVEDPVFRLEPHSLEPGLGKCPFDPLQPSASIMAGEKLFSAAAWDFMGKDVAFARFLSQWPARSAIRTEQHEKLWLNEPKFVGAFAIPETSSPDDDKVYFFFREVAVETGGKDKAIYTRVARVCKNDVGGQRSLVNKWTTFLKARIVCSVPGLNGIDTHFDELQDVFLLQTKDEKSPILYGVFTTSSSVFRGSAVCEYTMPDIRAVFNGPFSHREGADHQWLKYQGKIPYPRPGMCPSRTYEPQLRSTREFPDEMLAFARSHPLLHDTVRPSRGRPAFTLAGAARVTAIAVDRVEADDGPYSVFFLGTDAGTVLKAISISKSSWEAEEVILEELRVFKEPTPILSLKISPKRQQLYVASRTGVAQLSLHRCSSYGRACSECCLARDPYCAWDGTACTRYFPTAKRRARRQDVRHGNPATHCWDLNEGEHVEEKVVFGVESNATFLECRPKSRQASTTWLVQHPREEVWEEVKADDRVARTEHGLLIRRLQRRDAGKYYCRAREKSFSQTVTRVALRVLPGDLAESPDELGGRVKGQRDGPPPRKPPLRARYKDVMRLLGAPSPLGPDGYCEQLWRKRSAKGRPLGVAVGGGGGGGGGGGEPTGLTGAAFDGDIAGKTKQREIKSRNRRDRHRSAAVSGASGQR